MEGEQIVAHGKDPARLVRDARSQGVRIPYVFYVEPPRPGVVSLGLKIPRNLLGRDFFDLVQLIVGCPDNVSLWSWTDTFTTL